MPSVRARPALVAALAILAVAVAAATLDSAVATPQGFGASGNGGTGDQRGVLPGSEGSGSSVPLGPPEGGFGAFDLPCVELLSDVRFLLGAGVVVLGIGYWLYRRGGLLATVGFAAAFGPPAIVLHLLLTACGRERDGGGLIGGGAANDTTGLVGDAAAGLLGSGAAGGGTPVLSAVLFAVVGIALVAAVVLLVGSTGDDLAEPAATEPEPDHEGMAAIGRAAGRAADRIEDDADADNAIYRAWREMTTYLEVENPDSSTPAEFAAAAVDAGMEGDDVSELTALFEEVRYGTARPTEDRETRALAALRRIEAEYAGADE